MTQIDYHLVDVFTSSKYGGNQLAVFIDYEDVVTHDHMLQIARELNFSEITFIKKNHQNEQFDVRIFTPEYEVPFAGHPSLGTAFVISKYLINLPKEKITLNLKHAKIDIRLNNRFDVDNSEYVMQQAQPDFLSTYSHQMIVDGLGLSHDDLDLKFPIEEISTGLPYIIILVRGLEILNRIKLQPKKVFDFLNQTGRFKTNSPLGLTTSLFFVADETAEKSSDYSARMFCYENNHLIEDAATGSANGCFLAYLLRNDSKKIKAQVEQGYQMKRKSLISLEGSLADGKYSINVGGNVKDVGSGKWYI
ncbi:PhzF family phenazine biosynthesis protein [Reichenbachiella sp.]|uniref:PhzF family phenazine biosynthesis protein n=1 Tax=Reichenbachiella sp. TaxID=2184521 RepID=UPI003BB2240E